MLLGTVESKWSINWCVYGRVGAARSHADHCPQLESGARPDFRDINHRSSIQYALKHPQVLWLCESALRKHRAQEVSSPMFFVALVDAH